MNRVTLDEVVQAREAIGLPLMSGDWYDTDMDDNLKCVCPLMALTLSKVPEIDPVERFDHNLHDPYEDVKNILGLSIGYIHGFTTGVDAQAELTDSEIKTLVDLRRKFHDEVYVEDFVRGLHDGNAIAAELELWDKGEVYDEGSDKDDDW